MVSFAAGFDGWLAGLSLADGEVAVGDKVYIMFDSGVRSASDVFKALAIGAKFVFVGRLWVWGLSIMGEAGVRHGQCPSPFSHPHFSPKNPLACTRKTAVER